MKECKKKGWDVFLTSSLPTVRFSDLTLAINCLAVIKVPVEEGKE